ncbi:MAG: adenine deaminase [Rhodospirillaceae bacterium]|nr:adenine deaminase [Rhodospirillaceae bacterium]
MPPQRRGTTAADLTRRIDVAMGRRPADLVIRNARILDLATGALDPGDIAIADGIIVGVYERYEGRREIDGSGLTAVPGFVDAHVHIESSLVSPGEFDRTVLARGTTTAIADPHEIANVLGGVGLRYVLDSTAGLAMNLRVQLPSCVPATALETSGARLDAGDLLAFRSHPAVLGLAEMMDFPGVLKADARVLDKLAAFAGGPIDGHAPLVRGRDLNAYAVAGICNDHESTSCEEAADKLRRGLRLFIREGSAAKDAATLAPLLTDATSPFVAFCTDDRSPLDIVEQGHIDHCIRRAIAAGVPVLAAYRAASWSAAQAFGLFDRGMIAPGYRADIVLVDDLAACAVSRVIVGGRPVDDALFAGRRLIAPVGRQSVRLDPVEPGLFAVPASGPTVPVIGLRPGQLVTDHLRATLPFRRGHCQSDTDQDVLAVAVLERHGAGGGIGRGFVRGFGLRGGALASSVGHDSHNVIVVGDSDADMALAVNRVIALQGGFVAVCGGQVAAELALPIAGLMSDRPVEEVCRHLAALRAAGAALGCRMAEPFLALAFLALPVIPHLKITDRGLVDVDRQALIAA